MASSSPGRYQSRLFNWLSQGFSQIEKLQPHIRQLKTRVTWGVEVIFFSAYRLSQKWFTRRDLGQLDQPLAMDAASSSEAIQEILTGVQASKYSQLACLSSPAELDVATTLSFSQQDFQIQGIATLLDTRTLVLVDEQNQLLDILTPDQQNRLDQQITQKILGGQYQNRVTQAAQQHLGSRFQTTLGQLLAWMPRRFAQPIIARLKAQSVTGRLQESPTTPGLVVSPRSKMSQALTFLDSVSLRLEQGVGQMLRLNQRGLGQRSQTPTPDQASTKTDELRIRGLIRAAIAYFFNHKPQQFLFRASSQPSMLDSDGSAVVSSGSQQLASGLKPLIVGTKPRAKRVAALQQLKQTQSTEPIPDQEQPWLTMTDLFGGSAKADRVGTTSRAAMSVTSQSPKGRLATSKALRKSKVTTIDADTRVISRSYSDHGGSVDIETEAVLMEYVKHPLVQVLEWLDRRLAWLEEMAIVLWSQLQPYWAALLKLIQRYWQRYF